jgi:hypothetical protein
MAILFFLLNTDFQSCVIPPYIPIASSFNGQLVVLYKLVFVCDIFEI